MPDVWDKELKRAVSVDEASARAGILAGKYAPKRGEHLIADPESGYVGAVDSAQVHERLRSGWSFASPDQVLRSKARNSPAAAGLLGAADLVAMGAPNVAAQVTDRLGITEQATERMAALRQENPAAHMAGQVAAGILTLPKTAAQTVAKGALGTVVRGATAAPRAVMQVGAAAERAAAGLLGEGLAARAAAKGVGAATEGAFFGAAQGLTEADLGDPAQAAENILAAAGTGALYGGAFGAALPVVGNLVGGATRRTGKGLEALYEATIGGTAAKGVGAKAREVVGKLQKSWHPEQAGLLSELDDPLRRAEILGPDLVPDASRKLAGVLDRSEELLDEMAGQTLARTKLKRIQKAIKPELEAESVSATVDRLGALEETLVSMEQRPHIYGDGRGSFASVRKVVRDSFDELAKAPTAVTAYGVMDRTKRLIDKEINWGARRSRQPGADPFRDKVEQELITSNAGFRGDLESPKLWGEEAAGLQKETNSILGELRDTESSFRSKFMQKLGQGKRAGAYSADPGKLQTYLKDTQGVRNDIRGQVLQERLGTQDRMVKLLDDWYAPDDPKAAAQLQELRGLTSELRGEVGRVETTIAKRNQVEALARAGDSGSLGQMLADRWSPVAAGMMGGLPGAAAAVLARETYQAVANPFRAHMRLAKLQELGASSGASVKAKLETVIKGAARGAAVGARVTKDASRRAMTPTAVAMTSGPAAARREATTAKIAEIRAEAANPTQIYDRARTAMGPTADIAPALTQAMALHVSRQRAWLDANLPKPTDWPATYGTPPPLSDAEWTKARRQIMVAEDPLIALDKLQQGKLTIDEAEALRGMWPQLYAQVQQTAMELLATTESARGKSLMPYGTRVQLGLLLQFPADPSMQPRELQAAQQVWTAPPPAQADGEVYRPAGITDRTSSTMAGKAAAPADRLAIDDYKESAG